MRELERYELINNSFSGNLLSIDDKIIFNNDELDLIDGVIPNFINKELDKLTDKMSNFYNEVKFPNYNDLDDYASLYEINSIDSVLMFIPIEPALLTLYNEAADLIEKAWQKKIIIVGPSTLPFLLKAVENMWRIDKQSKTIKDIAASASEIYDKAVNVYDSFSTVNQSLDKARLKMDEAKSRLQDGPGSLTKKIEKMKKLGRLNTKKQLPEDSGNAID